MTDKHLRTSTAIRFRPDLAERLKAEAEQRDVSINFLVNRAVEDFLKHLLPVHEVRWTRMIHE